MSQKSLQMKPWTNRRFSITLNFLSSFEENPKKLISKISEYSKIKILSEEFDRNHWHISFLTLVKDSKTEKNLFSISSPLLEGSKGFKEIFEICEILKKLKCTVPTNSFLVINLDPLGLTGGDIAGLIRSYFLFETKIDSIMPNSFKKNKFSDMMLPVMEKLNLPKVPSVDFNFDIPLSDLISNLDKETYKVNLLSYVKNGTIEFRQHFGTLNPEKICHWINFLLTFVEESKITSKEFIQTKSELKEVEVLKNQPNPEYDRYRLHDDIATNPRITKICERIAELIDAATRNNQRLSREEIVEGCTQISRELYLIDRYDQDYNVRNCLQYLESYYYCDIRYDGATRYFRGSGTISLLETVRLRHANYLLPVKPQYVKKSVKETQRVETVIKRELKKVFPEDSFNKTLENLDPATVSYLEERMVEFS